MASNMRAKLNTGSKIELKMLFGLIPTRDWFSVGFINPTYSMDTQKHGIHHDSLDLYCHIAQAENKIHEQTKQAAFWSNTCIREMGFTSKNNKDIFIKCQKNNDDEHSVPVSPYLARYLDLDLDGLY